MLTKSLTTEAGLYLFVKTLLRRDPLNSGKPDHLFTAAVENALTAIEQGGDPVRALDLALAPTRRPASD